MINKYVSTLHIAGKNGNTNINLDATKELFPEANKYGKNPSN